MSLAACAAIGAVRGAQHDLGLFEGRDLARAAVSYSGVLDAPILRVMMKFRPGVRMIPGQRT
jgi:hypothetical protein